MGIATGEAELRDDDYFGPVLNRAARVMACGHGGQILIDGATAGLLTGVDLLDLGPGDYGTSPNRSYIFQVRAAGLPTDFPPLNTPRPDAGKPTRPHHQFCRTRIRTRRLDSALRRHRLVTLTGVGGVGKTRLAVELATRLTDSFPDGVWMIELATVGDPAAVPEAVAAVLGVTQQPGMSVADSVAAALEGRRRLLVFDNCEHVLDAAAEMIDAILARSTTVTVLATSREGLRVADEQLLPVPSLDVGHRPDSAAVTLFRRARAGMAADTVDQ